MVSSQPMLQRLLKILPITIRIEYLDNNPCILVRVVP
jgi:hypothetical protein